MYLWFLIHSFVRTPQLLLKSGNPFADLFRYHAEGLHQKCRVQICRHIEIIDPGVAGHVLRLIKTPEEGFRHPFTGAAICEHLLHIGKDFHSVCFPFQQRIQCRVLLLHLPCERMQINFIDSSKFIFHNKNLLHVNSCASLDTCIFS